MQFKNDIMCVWHFFKPIKVEDLLEDQGVHEVQEIPNKKEKHTCRMS